MSAVLKTIGRNDDAPEQSPESYVYENTDLMRDIFTRAMQFEGVYDEDNTIVNELIQAMQYGSDDAWARARYRIERHIEPLVKAEAPFARWTA